MLALNAIKSHSHYSATKCAIFLGRLARICATYDLSPLVFEYFRDIRELILYEASVLNYLGHFFKYQSETLNFLTIKIV